MLVAAETVVVDCTLRQQEDTGRIQPRVILWRNMASNRVTVRDGVMQTDYGAPIYAEIAAEAGGRVRISALPVR